MLPPVQLQGKASQLFVHENCLMVITTEATLTIWDISKKKRILSETIRHLGNVLFQIIWCFLVCTCKLDVSLKKQIWKKKLDKSV